MGSTPERKKKKKNAGTPEKSLQERDANTRTQSGSVLAGGREITLRHTVVARMLLTPGAH